MISRILGEEELARIYRKHMTRDFPQSELKPLRVILDGMRRGFYTCLGFTDADGALLAYAVLMGDREGGAVLADYFAVTEDMRGRGLGSEAMRLLADALRDRDCILIEYENPDDGNAEKARREVFYKRAGMFRTGMDLTLFGVRFCVGCIPLKKRSGDAELKRALIEIYQKGGYKKEMYSFADGLPLL